MADKPFPPLSQPLIDRLDQLFPERCPDPKWSEREVWRKVGQREVVRFLMKELENQSQNILRDPRIV